MGLDTILTLLFLASILWSVVSSVARAAGNASRQAREAAERARVEAERRRLERETDPNRRSYETYLGRGPEPRPVDAAVPAAPPPSAGPESDQSDQERLRRATAAKMGRPVEGGSPPRPPGVERGSSPRPRPEAARPRVEPAGPRPRPEADPFEMPPPRPSSLEGATLERQSAEGATLERAPAPPRRELPPTPAGPPRTLFGVEETEVARLARLAREDREARAVATAEPAVQPTQTVKRGTAVLEPRAIVRAIVWSEVLGPPKSRRR